MAKGARPQVVDDAESTFHRAQAFYLAGHRCALNLEVGPGVTQYLAAPAAVNFCFSIELFIKALIVDDRRTPKRIHDLGKLFAALPDEDRSAIQSHYEALPGHVDFSKLLTQVSDHFVKIRYAEYDAPFSFQDVEIAVLARAFYLYASRLSDYRPPIPPVAR